MKCLWLSRILPFPQTAGDRIYSLNLAKSLARAGAEVTFVGFAGDEPPESISDISWRIVPGQPRNEVASLASTMPYIAARHATASYKETISQLGRSDWDVVL